MHHFFNPIERKRTSTNILKEYLTTWLFSDISNCVLDYFCDDWRPCSPFHAFEVAQHLGTSPNAHSCVVKDNQACIVFRSFDGKGDEIFTACLYTKHDNEFDNMHPNVWILPIGAKSVNLLHFNVVAYVTLNYITILDLNNITNIGEHENQTNSLCVPIDIPNNLSVMGFCIHRQLCYILLSNREVIQMDLNGNVIASPFLVSKRPWWGDMATNCGANINDNHFFATTYLNTQKMFLSIFDLRSRSQVFEYELGCRLFPAYNYCYFNVTITNTNICTVSCAKTYLFISEIHLFRFCLSNNTWELFQSFPNFSRHYLQSSSKVGTLQIACIGEELAVTANDSFDVFHCLT